MKSYALVSCGKNKLQQLAKAKDLYTGELFKKCRQYVEKNHDGWSILSALHGLVNPETALEPYEYTLNGQSKQTVERWATEVIFRITQSIPVDTTIYIYAGREYRKFVQPVLEQKGYKVIVPMEGLGIGQQLGWLKEKLGR